MKRIIDLTGDNFARQCGTFQIIDSYIPRLCPESLELRTWGGGLWLEGTHELGDAFMTQTFGKDDLYVAGMGKLTFSGIKGGILKASPYNNSTIRGQCFLKNADGTYAEYIRDWGPEPPNYIRRLEYGGPPAPGGIEEYCLDAEIDWPHSLVEFLLYADGPATFEFDDNDLIPWKEYEANPEKYKFPNFGK